MFCSTEYNSEQGLSNHTNTKHIGERFECNTCKIRTTSKSSLLRHIKSLHLNETYQCDICEYQATQKYNLTIHIQNIHTGGKIIFCKECNKNIKHWSVKYHKEVLHKKSKKKKKSQN